MSHLLLANHQSHCDCYPALARPDPADAGTAGARSSIRRFARPGDDQPCICSPAAIWNATIISICTGRSGRRNWRDTVCGESGGHAVWISIQTARLVTARFDERSGPAGHGARALPFLACPGAGCRRLYRDRVKRTGPRRNVPAGAVQAGIKASCSGARTSHGHEHEESRKSAAQMPKRVRRPWPVYDARAHPACCAARKPGRLERLLLRQPSSPRSPPGATSPESRLDARASLRRGKPCGGAAR